MLLVNRLPFLGELSLDGCNAGEGFALDGFEQGSATRGDVGYLIGKTEFVHAGNAISSSDQREGSIGRSFHDGFADGFRAYGEVVKFEYSRGAVPKDRFGFEYYFAEFLDRPGAYVHTHPVVGYLHIAAYLGGCIVVEPVGYFRIHGEYQIDALFGCFLT